MTIDESSGRSKQYSDEEILGAISDVAARNDGKVTTELYKQAEDVPALSVVIDRFSDDDEDKGGWLLAKEAAGVGGDGRQHNSRPREYSNEEMLEMIETCNLRYGDASQSAFDSDEEFCSSSTVRQRFGSWSKAKREAGVA